MQHEHQIPVPASSGAMQQVTKINCFQQVAAHEELLLGTSKHYDKIRVLGKGSYGTASVHRRRADCSLVVLKEIDLQKFKGEREKQSAINEARIMSNLDHINIIKYHNAYTTDTKLVIEMEYASMGTLAAYLSFQIQPLEEQEVLIIFRQIASGLDYLHSMNIIHLDLKMANIFITIEGLIKIGDFSISQYMSSTQHVGSKSNLKGAETDKPLEEQFLSASFTTCNSTRRKSRHSCLKREKQLTSSHIGTLAYSSPERCLGEMTDFKSDIWSLGCILYELITSRPLFAGDCLPELVLNITRIQYQPIKRNITPALRDIFEQMIARDPNQRPSAKDLLCITGQVLSRFQLIRQSKVNKRQNNRFDLSTEVALMTAQDDLSQINYPHSLVYQVRLDSQHIHLDRVNLPQTKRIKEMSKGKSHYLVLTYDNIVYGWGSKTFGQLGACGLNAKNVDAKDLPAQLNSSAASSLASSTQTIVTAITATNKSNQLRHYQSTRQLISEMLQESQPTTRPFVINELNHRKIIQVAAGDNFSVFLSKTGIVMTCGDGSTGCLGRGDLKSCYTPCMVESLLNNDVVSISCGPKHVVAVCGNGSAFAWGKINHGRLGLGCNELGKEASSDSPLDSSGKYVLIPQQVQFAKSSANQCSSTRQKVKYQGRKVFIKNAYCGDRSTIFIDSENRCWACGENRFNKLGLDVRRRFKKTLVVENSWTTMEICSLNKYRIVTCNIGKNHSSFITSDGRLIVFGQDIDHNYRLKSNIMCARDSHRRISFELQTKRRGANQGTRKHLRNQKSTAYLHDSTFEETHKTKDKPLPPCSQDLQFSDEFGSLNYKQLTKLSISNNQLINFKSFENQPDSPPGYRCEVNAEISRYKLSRRQRVQLDSYLKKSRAIKRMPFECVVSVSCTSKFTLALTSDNHIYFWGTRSYRKDAKDSFSIGADNCQPCSRKPPCAEPQLVATSSDECFIKIGATNSSLMSNIQVLGSDQPIIHAQDPRLSAKSLADLWILDYKPSSSSSSSTSTSPASSTLSINELSCSSCSSIDSSCSRCISTSRDLEPNSNCLKGGNFHTHGDCMKHAAILEPQPIVSLYVPSMFNHHNGCSLNLVDLFCFDEDRFYLILDTTIKLQQNIPSRRQQQTMTSIPQTSKNAISQTGLGASPTIVSRTTKLNSVAELDNNQRQLDAVSELNMRSPNLAIAAEILKSDKKNYKETNAVILDKNIQEKYTTNIMSNVGENLDTIEETGILKKPITGENQLIVNQVNLLTDDLDSRSPPIKIWDNNNNNDVIHHISDNVGQNQADSSQEGGVSLEEPRSLSTFANSLGTHIVIGPSLNAFDDLDQEQKFKPLVFNSGHQQIMLSENISNSASSEMLDNGILLGQRSLEIKSFTRKRAQRIKANGSESTTACNDETSSMPDWVKNEYIHCKQQQLEADEALEVSSELAFQTNSSVTEHTYMSQDSLTSSNATIKSEPTANNQIDLDNGPANCVEQNHVRSAPCSDYEKQVVRDENTSLSSLHELDDMLARAQFEAEGEIDWIESHESLGQQFNNGNAESHQPLSASHGTLTSLEPSSSLKQARLLVISKSHPDISDSATSKHGLTTGSRRASIISQIQENEGGKLDVNNSNLLDCSVYKAKLGPSGSTSRYESSNFNTASELSSRSNSHSRLIKPERIDQRLHLSEQKLSNFPSSQQFTNGLNMNNPSTSMADASHLWSFKLNEKNFPPGDCVEPSYRLINRSTEDTYQGGTLGDGLRQKYYRRQQLTRCSSQTTSQSVTLLRQQQEQTLGKDVGAKAGSTSSLASLRRSLIKLFC